MLSIGHITVPSSLVLAPMSGITDLSFRLLNRSFGCELAFTEMISASALAYGNRNTLKMLSMGKGDKPLGIQILGNDPKTVGMALEKVSEADFDLLDINAACPSRKVVSGGRGAALMREPMKLQRLLEFIIDHTGIPVTVKIRAGWDETSVNAVEVARRARDAGISSIFIHGRTRKQAYRGTVDYGVIRNVKEAVDIPVIASGDALSPLLIKKLFDETGCDGVLVARGALGNPWIFRDTATYLKSGRIPARPDLQEVENTMKIHLLESIASSGEKVGILRFRKFFSWYTRGMAVKELKTRIFHTNSLNEMLQLISEVASLPPTRARFHLGEYCR